MSNPHRKNLVPEPMLLVHLLSDEDWDQLDELAADPCFNRPPGRRSKTDADRLLRLLDELEGRDG